jgi:metal-responsive CopG/Arc/MetJ family transcriptional regulator
MEGYKNQPGYRRISVNVPADLVVRIDLLAATRPDHPYRAEVVTEAIRVYLSQQVDQLSKLAPLLESSESSVL